MDGTAGGAHSPFRSSAPPRRGTPSLPAEFAQPPVSSTDGDRGIQASPLRRILPREHRRKSARGERCPPPPELRRRKGCPTRSLPAPVCDERRSVPAPPRK